MDRLKKISITTIFVILACFSISAQEIDPAAIPGMEGFQVKGDPEEYVGDDLFLLINGGAELYHEYGFEKVTVQDFHDETGKHIYLEIYEFNDTPGAWGIFTANRTSDCHTTDLVSFACMSATYLIWQNGKNFILLKASDFINEEEARYVMMNMADHLGRSMTFDNQRVIELLELVPEELDRDKIRYFKGNMGLSNIYSFHYQDIFNIKEGLSYPGADEMIFMISTEDCDMGTLENFFSDHKKYKEVNYSDGVLRCMDNKDNHILIMQNNTWMFVQVSKNREPGRRMLVWSEYMAEKGK